MSSSMMAVVDGSMLNFFYRDKIKGKEINHD